MKLNNYEFMKLFTTPEMPDKDVSILCKEKRAVLSELVRSFYEDENGPSDLDFILEYDDYLTELLVDKTAYLNIVESELGDEPLQTLEAEDPPFSGAEVEEAYLSLADTLFEASKLINPLGGFGKDRLEAGLSLIRSFEERFWPLATRITAENAAAFRDLIPPEHYDDILAGRKRAIGALRLVGDLSCAAGAIVYTVPPSDDGAPMIRLDWIMVHEDLRQKGTGNFLIAQVLELTFQHEGMGICTDLPVKRFENELEEAELPVLYNCLDSWDLLFDLTLGSSFALKISDCRGNKAIDQKPEKVISLRKLGDRAAEMMEQFFKGDRNDYDEDLKDLSPDFFDKDISCAVLSDGRIRAMLLFHRIEEGLLRYEGLVKADGSDAKDILNLLRFTYGACMENGYEDGMIFGAFRSEEGMEMLGRIIPEVQITMLYRGTLVPEEINLSSADWDLLRKEAGLSDDKIPEEGLTDGDIGQEEVRLIGSCLQEAVY